MSGNSYDVAVGERASHIRKVLSMTLNEVADILNITRQTLSNYESGRTPMRADVVRSLCEVYGISPSWLLGIDDELWHKSTRNGRTIEMREKSPSIPSPRKGAQSERQGDGKNGKGMANENRQDAGC